MFIQADRIQTKNWSDKFSRSARINSCRWSNASKMTYITIYSSQLFRNLTIIRVLVSSHYIQVQVEIRSGRFEHLGIQPCAEWHISVQRLNCSWPWAKTLGGRPTHVSFRLPQYFIVRDTSHTTVVRWRHIIFLQYGSLNEMWPIEHLAMQPSSEFGFHLSILILTGVIDWLIDYLFVAIT